VQEVEIGQDGDVFRLWVERVGYLFVTTMIQVISKYSVPVMEKRQGYNDNENFHKFCYYVARLTPMDLAKPWPTDEFLHAKLSTFQKSLKTWCEMPPESSSTDLLVKAYATADHHWRKIICKVALHPSNKAEDWYFHIDIAVPSKHHDCNFPSKVNLSKIPLLVVGSGAGGSASHLVSAGAGAAVRSVDSQTPRLSQLAGKSSNCGICQSNGTRNFTRKVGISKV
jgi:hypothetical protein